jgi:hypothetical protein
MVIKRIFGFIAVTVFVNGSGIVLADETCQITPEQREAILSASVDDFDNGMDPSKSWRTIMGNGCPDEAVALIKAYINRHQASLSGGELRQMRFHMGQALAMFNRKKEAASYLPAAIDPDPLDSGAQQWNAYVQGTIAFLTGNRSDMKKALEKYKAEGGGGSRGAFLEGFYKCLDAGYMEASAGQC